MENFWMYGIYKVVFKCLIRFPQTHLTTLPWSPVNEAWDEKDAQFWKKQYLCVLSCTTMPLPDNEPFNIRFVGGVEKYKCRYDTLSPV